jgi:hypothetical protein
MPTPTLRQKRVIVGIYLAAFLLAVANRFLEWGLFGRADRAFYVVVILIGMVGLVRFVPKMMEEMRAHQTARRKAEEAEELARDKSGDAAEAERISRAIGMPPNTSLERTRAR